MARHHHHPVWQLRSGLQLSGEGRSGRVSYSGDGSFDISGHVGDAGAVSVTIARGDQKASGSGKLSANSGSGQWSGKSSSTACSGRWEATRA
jgi:hypothetical protein